MLWLATYGYGSSIAQIAQSSDPKIGLECDICALVTYINLHTANLLKEQQFCTLNRFTMHRYLCIQVL